VTARQDLIIRQGETYSFTWTKRDSAGAAVDLTGYTARMRVKDTYNGVQQVYLTSGADSQGGAITLGGAAGTVVLSMTADQSAALASEVNMVSILLSSLDLNKPQKTYLYDLELVSGAGAVARELEGRVVVRREITT
jgi:hypothetical protein